MKFRTLPALLKETVSEWSTDQCLRLGASLAYYTLSSLIPLLLIVLAIATFVLHFTGLGQNLQAQLIGAISQAVNNPDLAAQITSGLIGKQADAAGKGTVSGLLGVVFLLLAASGVFGELDAAFNIIWNVPAAAQAKGLWGFLRTKFRSMTLVLGVAFLLLVAQVLTAVLNSLAASLPLGVLWALLNLVAQVGLITVVFAALFKFLPDTPVAWGDVWTGGLLTALLWIAGQQLLTLYFRYGTSFSSYGALGGVLAFLVYVYYSSQILFLGGEFTQVYARTHGSRRQVGQEVGAPPAITKEAALLVTTATSVREQQRQAELAGLKTRQVAAAATGGLIGLVGGALIGGVGLVVGLMRGAARLRGR